MGRFAVVFAGQGAQSVGMGKDLVEAYPECRDLFAQADDVLGRPLSKICFEGPIEDLTRSDNCQPAVFVMSVACYRALRLECETLDVAGMAGLSLGEWTALHSAGVLRFEDALRVLEARGRFMQQACEEKDGGMVSVMGLPMAKLEEVCAAAGVQIANLNSAQQTVLSGEKKGIGEADRLAKEAGAKRTVILNVAGAFHSRLMASAAEKLRETLASVAFSAPRIPVVSNVTGQAHGGPDGIREAMIQQVTSSVRWMSCVEWFKGQGVAGYIECGPGRVLSGLIKQIDTGAALHNIQDCSSLQKAVQGLKGA